ncbi:unnamed protein product [Penicillium camemberti]|uniref:Str. FM013 n=1 Tax=Penicillium camemberti (strain FM 013) TaxID=1429867 RepID=A0A0G4PQR6_PENC3|nr:unnamed protein product [Penicillium camemberti]
MLHCKARKLKVASTPNHRSNVGSLIIQGFCAVRQCQATSGSFWKAVEPSSDDMDLMAASGTPRV